MNEKTTDRDYQEINKKVWKLRWKYLKLQTEILQRLNIDIRVLSETKKEVQAQEMLRSYTHMWNGVPRHERAAKKNIKNG